LIKHQIIICMQPMRTHVTHGLAMDCLCVGKVGNKSTNIRATHQCLLNRMQALHKRLRNVFSI